RRPRLPASEDARDVVDIRLRGGTTGTVGLGGEIPAHRALQVFPRTRLETNVARQATAAAAGTLPLPPRRVSLAGGNAAHKMGHPRGEAVMSPAQRVLLINPTITGKRHARFPLAVLSLSTALQGRHSPTILDGNIDRDFVASAA